jgi:hypothetical protein
LRLLAGSAPALAPAIDAEPYLPGNATAPARVAWEAFAAARGAGWRADLDPRTGLVVAAEGPGIPWPAASETSLASLESAARLELATLGPALGLMDGDRLVLDQGRSGPAGDALWSVDFDVVRGGLQLEAARIVLRVSHGNLIQLGGEGLPVVGLSLPEAKVGLEQARELAGAGVGGWLPTDLEVAPARLSLLPIRLDSPAAELGFVRLAGRSVLPAWTFSFRRRGEPGTWRVRINAVTGAVLELVDQNRSGVVRGGAYPASPAVGPQLALPMPWADVGSGVYADGAGRHAASGFTTRLDGELVTIADHCGGIALAPNDWHQNVDFGSSAGTDCATPGFGGAGNTAAARSQYYQVTRAKEVLGSWLPGNTWLQQKLRVDVNLNQVCNAYWNGTSLNFFRSGGGCNNTGELAGLALHELGHALDEHDGSGYSPDNTTGEAYADFTAALILRDSCIAPGFTAGVCGGYGDGCASCTGVREIDWARHAGGGPHTPDNFIRPSCPVEPTYPGVCGREAHCESQVMSEALWDLAARDLAGAGSAAAWAVAERLWYPSRSIATSAFSCSAGATFVSSGCNVGSLWKTLRALDDDDGNLANGTPHSCQILAALGRHALACPSDPGADVCFAGCTPAAAPVLDATPGTESVDLAWSDAGPGIVYDLARGELGCDIGAQVIGRDLTSTSFADTAAGSGRTYHYRVSAHPAGLLACASPPSDCVSATALTAGCLPLSSPPTPTATVTAADEVTVTWPTVAGADGYAVFHAPTAAGPFVYLASTTGAAFVHRYLPGGSTHAYQVHAFVGDCESAPAGPATATVPACSAQTLYEQAFDTDPAFELGTLVPGGTNDWQSSPQVCGSASALRFGGPACEAAYGVTQAAWIATPQVAIPTGSTNTRLIVAHRYAFEAGQDGGRLAARLDGNPQLTLVDGTMIVAGPGYSGALAADCPPVAGLAGLEVFTGLQGSAVTTEANLDALCDAATSSSGGCAGRQVQPTFLAIADCGGDDLGWFIDRVAVTACARPGLLSSGFESGDLTAWSGVTPLVR